MNEILASLVALLVVAVLVALAARRLKLPYTVGLVATGTLLAWLRLGPAPPLTHDLIYLIVLPPLLFEAALNIHWKELQKDALPVLVLSTIGVVISAAVVTGGMHWALGWPLAPALVFGVLIAATDPVAVIAMFKDLGVTGRLRFLVESESLFNDGVAAVLFALALAWALPDVASPNIASGSLALLRIAGGGVLAGLAVGAVALLAAGRTGDHLVSAAVTTVAAYGSFLLAEHFHVSGVLATVCAGLVIGNAGMLGETERRAFSTGEREFALGLWDFAAFIANSFIFLMIGLALADVPFARLGLPALAIAVLLVLLGRGLTVYPLAACFARTRWAIPMGEQHVLWWGGLRGALALALARSRPPDMPLAGEIRVAAFGVVIFSVVMQGLTMPWLLKKIGAT